MRVPPHGTRARYESMLERCRCTRCRRANTAYQRAYRERTTPRLEWAEDE